MFCILSKHFLETAEETILLQIYSSNWSYCETIRKSSHFLHCCHEVTAPKVYTSWEHKKIRAIPFLTKPPFIMSPSNVFKQFLNADSRLITHWGPNSRFFVNSQHLPPHNLKHPFFNLSEILWLLFSLQFQYANPYRVLLMSIHLFDGHENHSLPKVVLPSIFSMSAHHVRYSTHWDSKLQFSDWTYWSFVLIWDTLLKTFTIPSYTKPNKN